MKKYKKNITIKVACVFTEFMISMALMILIMFLFLEPKRLTEYYKAVLLLIVMILGFNLFLFLISLIGRIFIKTTYIIDNDILIVQNKDNNKVVDLREVKAITYDLGEISRYGNHPTLLVLFDNDYNYLISIENPPLSMVLCIKKKCNYASISYYNSKRFLFIILVSIAVAVVLGLMGIMSK